MSSRTHSGSDLLGFVFLIAVVIAASVGVMMLASEQREPPLRTAELSIPTPALPSPGTIPQTEAQRP